MSDGKLRWGQNTVTAIRSGGAYWGALPYATFDQTGGDNEALLAFGDSSGPLFINDVAGWKLAAVAAVVDSAFSLKGGGDSGFDAAIFDARGLYFGTPNKWQAVSGPKPASSGFDATRIFTRTSWIDGILMK